MIAAQEEVDPRVDALYDLAPDDFTAARNALVRALKSEDRRDEAAQVAKLRRPAVAAWAVNQAVRRHRDRFNALLEAGTEVRRTQRRALSGVRQSGLREATRARRELIDELTGLAFEALTERGANAETHRGDITATFDSASADEDAAATVAAARLTAPLPLTSGFGSLDGLAVLPDEPDDEATTPAAEDAADVGDAGDADAAERERVAKRRRQAMRAVEEARRLVADAEKAARRAADAVVARSAAADQAERAAREAEQTWRRRQKEAADLREQVTTEERRAEQARAEVDEHTALLREREQQLHELDG